MAERLKVNPLEAAIILANELWGGGQYSETVTRSLHGPKWKEYYSGINSPILNPQQFLEDVQRGSVLVDMITQMLEGLVPRKKHIVGLRFGQEDGILHTLSDISRDRGLSSVEGARKIIARELRRLRHPSRSKNPREDFFQQ